MKTIGKTRAVSAISAPLSFTAISRQNLQFAKSFTDSITNDRDCDRNAVRNLDGIWIIQTDANVDGKSPYTEVRRVVVTKGTLQ